MNLNEFSLGKSSKTFEMEVLSEAYADGANCAAVGITAKNNPYKGYKQVAWAHGWAETRAAKITEDANRPITEAEFKQRLRAQFENKQPLDEIDASSGDVYRHKGTYGKQHQAWYGNTDAWGKQIDDLSKAGKEAAEKKKQQQQKLALAQKKKQQKISRPSIPWTDDDAPDADLSMVSKSVEPSSEFTDVNPDDIKKMGLKYRVPKSGKPGSLEYAIANNLLEDSHGKIPKNFQAVNKGLHIYSDAGKLKQDFASDHALYRLSMALASSNGKEMSIPMDSLSWYGKRKTVHPYSDVEVEMLKHAYKEIGIKYEDPNEGDNRSKEPEGTHTQSPVLKVKFNF